MGTHLFSIRNFSSPRRFLERLMIGILCLLPFLSAKGEGHSKFKQKLAFIRMLKDRETQAVREIKAKDHDLFHTREAIQLFRRLILDPSMGVELRLRTTLALAVICYWPDAKALCQQELDGLNQGLVEIGDSRLAGVVRSHRLGASEDSVIPDAGPLAMQAAQLDLK